LTLEDRITALEQENQALKRDIQDTLLSLHEDLQHTPPRPAGERWSRRAWALALLNLVLALTLFVNVNYFTLEGLPADLSATTVMWLRGLWVALSFVWLVLQLYPLALLYESEERALRGIAWRNALKMLGSSPALLVSLTGGVLLVALISAIAPIAWLWLVVTMIVIIAGFGLCRVLVSVLNNA
jgi:hypothetical protein